MTNEEIRAIIDGENGQGYSNNLNLKGYQFKRKNSFIIFELKNLEDLRICHIKYIYFDNVKDLITVMVHACNFWRGNKIQFLFYKEKHKNVSARKLLENLNFRSEELENVSYKYPFHCKIEDSDECNCIVHTFYK